MLIVEDSVTEARMLEGLLARLDVPHLRVRHAPSVGAAVAALAEFKPDVVLLDLVLGADASGLSVLASLPSGRDRPGVVIVSSLRPHDPEASVGRASGAAFVQKPVRTEELRAAVAHAFAAR